MRVATTVGRSGEEAAAKPPQGDEPKENILYVAVSTHCPLLLVVGGMERYADVCVWKAAGFIKGGSFLMHT